MYNEQQLEGMEDVTTAIKKDIIFTNVEKGYQIKN